MQVRSVAEPTTSISAKFMLAVTLAGKSGSGCVVVELPYSAASGRVTEMVTSTVLVITVMLKPAS